MEILETIKRWSAITKITPEYGATESIWLTVAIRKKSHRRIFLFPTGKILTVKQWPNDLKT